MKTLLLNLDYMSLNLFLALIPVVFGWLMLKSKNVRLKLLYGFVWLIFLPNTAYILLDIIHIFEQWGKVDYLFKLILTIQYSLFILLGALTFIYAIYFFEKLFTGKNKSRSNRSKNSRRLNASATLLVLNFLIGFGVILGFTQRTNSWYIFTQPLRVIGDALTLFYSPNLIAASLAFGLLANIIYFYFSKPVITFFKNLT